MPRIFHKSLLVGAESIDAVGHVNNREYLRWMEEVAVEHSAARGWPMQRYFDAQTAWVASTHFIEYLRPSYRDDRLDVHTWIAAWDRRTCQRRYAVSRQHKVLARGETRWTFVDLASGRAVDLPAAVRGAFDTVTDDDPELRLLGLVRRSARGSSKSSTCSSSGSPAA